MASTVDNIKAALESKFPADKGFEVEVEGVGQELSPFRAVVKKDGAVVAEAKTTVSLSEFLAKF